MKKTLLLLVTSLLITGCTQQTVTPVDNTLTVYTYDSLAADYGLLPAIQDTFETESGLQLEIVTFADTGAMVSQLLLEQSSPQADVVLGIDNSDVARYGDAGCSARPPLIMVMLVCLYITLLSFPEPISLETLAEGKSLSG